MAVKNIMSNFKLILKVDQQTLQ